jgi:hypothetical protein
MEITNIAKYPYVTVHEKRGNLEQNKFLSSWYQFVTHTTGNLYQINISFGSKDIRIIETTAANTFPM